MGRWRRRLTAGEPVPDPPFWGARVVEAAPKLIDFLGEASLSHFNAVKAVLDAAFAQAAKVVSLDLVNNRLIPNAMEPRAALGEYDPTTGDYTLHTTSQNPHLTRLLVAAFVLLLLINLLQAWARKRQGGL